MSSNMKDILSRLDDHIQRENPGANAYENFSNGFNCAESVLLGLVQALDMKCDFVPQIATPFGAGIGRAGELCGALSGAIMAIGLKLGRTSGDDNPTKSRNYDITASLLRTFREKFGAIRCTELIKCDLQTPEGQQKATDTDIRATFCPELVRFAAEEAHRLITNG